MQWILYHFSPHAIVTQNFRLYLQKHSIWEDKAKLLCCTDRANRAKTFARPSLLPYCNVILWVSNGGREYVMKINSIPSNLISLSICTCLTSYCNWQLLPVKHVCHCLHPRFIFIFRVALLLSTPLHHTQCVCPIQKRMIWIPPANKGLMKQFLCNKQSHLFEWIA